MNWLKRNPKLGSVILLLVAALGTEAWFWWCEREPARRALAALEQKKQERDWLARQSPALSEANVQAILRDLANTRQVVVALRAGLQGKDTDLAPTSAPAKSIDLFFDIAAFVENSRALAARAHVVIRPDERFGFASHANEGPAADLVPAVFRQRLVGKYLVEALLESHPLGLLAVQRERPLTEAQRTQRNQPVPPGSPALATPAAAPAVGGNSATTDFFELDPRLSVRMPGVVDSEAFRLEFTGQTPALRSFLNSLATFKLPVIVRSVEVEPVTGGGGPATDAATPPAAGAPVPLVSQNLSRFSVVVEFVAIPPVAGAPAS